jgi:hypothetical protein
MTQTTLLLSRLSLCLFFLLIPLLVVIEFQRPPQRPVLPALLIAYRIDLLCWLYFSGVTYFVLMQYSTQHRLVLSLVIAEPFISLFNPERHRSGDLDLLCVECGFVCCTDSEQRRSKCLVLVVGASISLDAVWIESRCKLSRDFKRGGVCTCLHPIHAEECCCGVTGLIEECLILSSIGCATIWRYGTAEYSP